MSPHVLNATVFAIAFFSAACLIAGLWTGKHLTLRRHRHDYSDGYDEGEANERSRWETITGRTYDSVKGILRDRPLPVGRPMYRAQTVTEDETPTAAVLLAQADTLIQARQEPAPEPETMPDYLAAAPAVVRLPEAEPGPPVVADITTAPVLWPAPGPQEIIQPASPVAAYARLAVVRAEVTAFLAKTDARCDAFLVLTHAETDAFLSTVPET